MSGFIKNAVDPFNLVGTAGEIAGDLVGSFTEGLAGEPAPVAEAEDKDKIIQDSSDDARARARAKIKRQQNQSTLLGGASKKGGSTLLG